MKHARQSFASAFASSQSLALVSTFRLNVSTFRALHQSPTFRLNGSTFYDGMSWVVSAVMSWPYTSTPHFGSA